MEHNRTWMIITCWISWTGRYRLDYSYTESLHKVVGIHLKKWKLSKLLRYNSHYLPWKNSIYVPHSAKNPYRHLCFQQFICYWMISDIYNPWLNIGLYNMKAMLSPLWLCLFIYLYKSNFAMLFIYKLVFEDLRITTGE